MKSKIASIGLLTIAVLVLSILVLDTSIGNMKEEALLLNSTYTGSSVSSDEITEGVLELPVYQKRSISATRSAPEFSSESSVYPVLPSGRRAEASIASTQSQPFSGTKFYARGSQRASDGDNQVNYRPMAVIPAWREKPSATISTMASGQNTKSEEVVSKVSAPFSGGGISGPMKMEGDGENPPPEGVGVGNGLWFMLLLAGIYIFIKSRKMTVQQ